MPGPSALQAAIYDRDNGRCRLCDKSLKLGSRECRINYVIPLEQGGPDEYFNLQLSCESCDKDRGQLSNSEYEEYLYSKNRKRWDAFRKAQGRRQTTVTDDAYYWFRT